MVAYEYTQINRIEQPHNYMYAPFLGSDFLRSYFRDRTRHIANAQEHAVSQYEFTFDCYACIMYADQLRIFIEKEIRKSDKDGQLMLDMISYDKALLSDCDIEGDIISIQLFSIENTTDLEELLTSVMYNQLKSKNDLLVKEWIDRLVQRFEVTKKLYETYDVGFRRGIGGSDILRLYWLFSMILSSYYVKTKKIKYLNVLLKVLDLLSSLDQKKLLREIPGQGLLLVLVTDVLAVKILSGEVMGGASVFK